MTSVYRLGKYLRMWTAVGLEIWDGYSPLVCSSLQPINFLPTSTSTNYFVVDDSTCSGDRRLELSTKHTGPLHVTSFHIRSRHVTSCHVISRHVMPRHVPHVTSYATSSRNVTSCHVLPRDVTSPSYGTSRRKSRGRSHDQRFIVTWLFPHAINSN